MIKFRQPATIAFGQGCSSQCVEDLLAKKSRRVLLITSPQIVSLAEPIAGEIERAGIEVNLSAVVDSEPTVEKCEKVIDIARGVTPDAVVAIGGGSVIDISKIVSALHNNPQNIRDLFGLNHVLMRDTLLICIPTTAGSGSEASPASVIQDSVDQMKKGVVSPFLVPDAAYIDPLLTLTVPPRLTAETGLDALTHCIEVYANRFSHPMIDLYALEGVRLISNSLVRAVHDGNDLQARENLARASFYGGMGLGPVNTASIHAMAHALGGEYHIPHGLSNSLLLPHVIRFNIQVAPERYESIARAMGVKAGSSMTETALRGVDRIVEISRQCGIDDTLSSLGVPYDAIPNLASEVMGIKRLLKNNLREMTIDDIESIFKAIY